MHLELSFIASPLVAEPPVVLCSTSALPVLAVCGLLLFKLTLLLLFNTVLSLLCHSILLCESGPVLSMLPELAPATANEPRAKPATANVKTPNLQIAFILFSLIFKKCLCCCNELERLAKILLAQAIKAAERADEHV